MKKTKITATIGPASDSEEILEELFKSGLNVCRLNFSHGSHEEHRIRINRIKKIREKLDLPIGIMLDTKGPEIRLGKFSLDKVDLEIGDEFILTKEDIIGDEKRASVSYKKLAEDIKIGDRILIDDGLVELEVIAIEGDDVVSKALNHGSLRDYKGVNIPNVIINLPSLTEKDIEDIIFGIEEGVDFIAASFIRRPEDIIKIRKVLEENKGEDIHIIAKIENREGLDNIEGILEVADGLMVARGDLGVEIAAEEIPLAQKDLIKAANRHGKPVITATQMLDSMIRNPRPTRAEVTDVANAILDGTDSIMLSGETAAGKYPIEAVRMMEKIAVRIENSLNYQQRLFYNREFKDDKTTTASISRSSSNIALDLGAKAIITATSQGGTARAVSKYKPKSRIIAGTADEKVMRKLSLVWGVEPVLTKVSKTTDEVIDNSIKAALEKHYVEEGDLVVVTAGIPVGISGSTNLIKVHTIGSVLIKGTGIGNLKSYGRILLVKELDDLVNNFRDGDIIVSKTSYKEMVPYIERSNGLIVEEAGLTSHGAIVGLNLHKPTIVAAIDASTILKTGMEVTIDSSTGQVYKGEARVL